MGCLKIQSPTGLFLYNFYQHLTFFGGYVHLSKDTITKPYKNLFLETLSRKQNIEFEKVSNLTAHINFKMKHSYVPTLMIKTEPPRKTMEK